MACEMSTADLYRIFDKLDENRDGLVSIDELIGFLQKLGFHTSFEDLIELLGGVQFLDPIDFCFFHDSIIKQKIKDDIVLKGAFGIFDSNGDGFISSEELQIALSKMGLWDQRPRGKQNSSSCKIMIQKYDTNSDGKLDFEEFKKMMLQLSTNSSSSLYSPQISN